MRLHNVGLTLGFLGFMLLAGMAYSKTHFYEFVLQETNFTRLCTTKSMLTVNGSFPGPTIQARKGDTIYVNVINQGNYGVTIHWHGVKQPRNPWSDGPENITQCPIQSGQNFTYEIVLSDEEGTLWWHAHSDWSRATVHGAIVILPKLGTTYPFPRPFAQQTIILGPWFNGDVKQIIDEAISVGRPPQDSDAHTINGQPGDLYPCSNGTTFRMRVDRGRTYLLRIINAAMNEEQFFGITNHTLTVVAQDAAYVKPFSTDYIMITPGQTMDVLVTANQTPSHYYMASRPFFDSNTGIDRSNATAIFQYNGRYPIPSNLSFPNLPAIEDKAAAENFTSKLKSLVTQSKPVNVPKNITEQLYVTIAVNQMPCPNNESCTTIAASLNNVSFVIPDTDVLQAYYRNLNGVFNRDFPSIPENFFNFTGDTSNISSAATTGTKAKMLKYGDAVEIVFQGTSFAPQNHPMHVHGFSFYLVGTGLGNFNNETDPQSYNLIDPPLINTVAVPGRGWAAIRFFADNPGVWFIHCHLERHSSWGMDTVLIVQNGNTNATSVRPPPANMPSCS